MTTDSDSSVVRVITPNLVAFFIGLALAWFLHWETSDLVWSLWLSSLVIGYSTILFRIGYSTLLGWRTIHDDGYTGPNRLASLLIGGGVALFFLAFFSVHFCGFHAGHSVFLSQFFPLEGLPDDGFGEAFINPILLWKLVFQHLMIPYGLFIIPTFIAERNAILKPFRKDAQSSDESEDLTAKKPRKELTEDLFAGPYKNVIRMHILIFFFGGCHFLKIDSFAVYVVVSAVYFLPWSELKQLWSNRDRATEA
ncbi:MAG: DUF6498-containing protein [Verrucomicrobiales bacterium]|nr:DUF6498-containing protein [Verrucomicrobiales bacterium]